jgi:hypothetical protein
MELTSQGKFDCAHGPTTYWKDGYKDWLGNEKHNEGWVPKLLNAHLICKTIQE